MRQDAVPNQKKSNQLTPMQEAFCQAYIRTWNGTQAAKEAGCTAKSAYAQGSKWLRQPKILRRINDLLESRQQREEKSFEKLLERLWKMSDIEMETYVVKGNIKATAILAKYYGIDVNRIEGFLGGAGGGMMSQVLVSVIEDMLQQREARGLPELPALRRDDDDSEVIDVTDESDSSSANVISDDDGVSPPPPPSADPDDDQGIQRDLERLENPMLTWGTPAAASLEEAVTLNRKTIKPSRKKKGKGGSSPSSTDKSSLNLDDILSELTDDDLEL